MTYWKLPPHLWRRKSCFIKDFVTWISVPRKSHIQTSLCNDKAGGMFFQSHRCAKIAWYTSYSFMAIQAITTSFLHFATQKIFHLKQLLLIGWLTLNQAFIMWLLKECRVSISKKHQNGRFVHKNLDLEEYLHSPWKKVGTFKNKFSLNLSFPMFKIYIITHASSINN